MHEKQQLDGYKCKVCGKQAVGYEPRFGYFYCREHEHTPPARIHEESLKYGQQNSIESI